ncbi:GIY-YIG nuclease family protein [Palleronia sp.]|uniref:GIY-YIG nuclease family protein n=1 Tax=Palleronia sp. TaxID=1940284 RepID=UPI0035C79342
MIGCADRVVYIGQSNQLSQRSIDSLGRIYHRVSDTSLPWSMAFAPCAYEHMDEHESAAIRAYEPDFNTSIPSLDKSLGQMPVVAGTAQVFADQTSPSTAFSPDCVRRQIDEATKSATPLWRRGKVLPQVDASIPAEQKFDLREVDTFGRNLFDALSSQRRRAQRRSTPTQRPERIKTYFEHKGVEIHIDELMSDQLGRRHLSFEWMARSYGKIIASGTEPDKASAAKQAIDAAEEHLAQPYRFKINLCDDGSVVTRDGEYLGTWRADENGHPSFTPDGETEVMFFEMWIGLLCQKIADWHEEQDQTST